MVADPRIQLSAEAQLQLVLARAARTLLDHNDGPDTLPFDVALKHAWREYVYHPDPNLVTPLGQQELAALANPGQHDWLRANNLLTETEARVVLLLAAAPLPAKQIPQKLRPKVSATKLRLVVASLRQRGVLGATGVGLAPADSRWVAAAREILGGNT